MVVRHHVGEHGGRAGREHEAHADAGEQERRATSRCTARSPTGSSAIQNIATARNTRPTTIGRRVPMRGEISPVSGATTIGASVHGIVITPASSGVWPCTTCRNWIRMKIAPKMPKLKVKPTRFATVKLRSRNSRRGSSGAAVRDSQITKATSSTAPATSEPTHLEAVPAGGVAAHDAEDERRARRGRRAAGRRRRRARAAPKLFGSAKSTSGTAMMPSGTFSQKIACQFQPCDDGAADERAERDAEAGDATPDADGGGPQALAHGAGEQGQRERHERCGADALHGAGGDELPRFGRERAERGRDREDHDAGEEDACGGRSGRRGRRP